MATGDNSIGAKQICVIGVGGGGCNAVSSMAMGWENGPSVVAINTDAQALEGTQGVVRLQIGEKITRGMGTGGDVTVGRLSAEDDFGKLRDLCAPMDLVVVVTALGGGTGTGAAPVVARAAHETGALVIAFATLPFAFEGERRMAQARQGVAALQDHADVVIVVPNQALFAAAGGNATAADAFRQADYILSMGVFAIWKLLVQRGLINIDFATLRMVARCSGGVSVFSYGEGRGFTRADEAAQAALHSPLIEDGAALANAESVLVSILGGPDMAIREVESIMNAIRKVVRKDAHIFMGTAIDEQWRDTVSVTLVASQFWTEEETGATETGDPETEAEETPKPATGGKKKKRPAVTQPQLGFESLSKGIFKDVEPTHHMGEDLDIPTFMRRRVVVEK
jgi:cell division protein FtsZ